MGEWKQGTFGCFDNCSLCIMSYFCPCIVFGRTAEKVGESCLLCGFCLLVSPCDIFAFIKIRGKVRELKGIDGSTCNDLVCLIFCPFCSLVQTAAEMEDAAPQAIARE